MTTNLSLSLLKYCIIMLVGAYLGARFSPEKKAARPIETSAAAETSSKANATCVVKKVTDSKGNITETIESSSNLDNSSKSEAAIVIQNEKNNSLDIFLGAGLNTSLKAYGSLELVYGDHAAEIKSDLVKDHSIYYKRKVLEWE